MHSSTIVAMTLLHTANNFAKHPSHGTPRCSMRTESRRLYIYSCSSVRHQCLLTSLASTSLAKVSVPLRFKVPLDESVCGQVSHRTSFTNVSTHLCLTTPLDKSVCGQACHLFQQQRLCWQLQQMMKWWWEQELHESMLIAQMCWNMMFSFVDVVLHNCVCVCLSVLFLVQPSFLQRLLQGLGPPP